MFTDKLPEPMRFTVVIPFLIIVLIVLAGCRSSGSLADDTKESVPASDEALIDNKQIFESPMDTSQAVDLKRDELKSIELETGEPQSAEPETILPQNTDPKSGNQIPDPSHEETILARETPVLELPMEERPVSIRRPITDMRVEVDINTRKLYVYSGDQMVSSYPVAVGRNEWPTRTGRWNIYAVVWNPWWHPPDQEWAWGRPIMAPGDPDNPLGRAQLVYDSPRSIHGTNDPASIGRAVSHGSIRVTNDVAMELARQVMEAVGYFREEEWFETVRYDASRHELVKLPEPVPIRVYRSR